KRHQIYESEAIYKSKKTAKESGVKWLTENKNKLDTITLDENEIIIAQKR
ncbi:MAG: hypothetical protein HC831_11470, partial [Chloroflexia bacterium]|nr:hypothetical protein [Chloroflexia bacterium]